MSDSDRLHASFANEVGVLFGVSYQVYREFNTARDEFEWIVFTRLFGRRVRFDVSIPAEDVGEKYALENLVAQLTYQIMDIQEDSMLHGMKPVFAVDRQDTTGIANPQVIIEPPI